MHEAFNVERFPETAAVNHFDYIELNYDAFSLIFFVGL